LEQESGVRPFEIEASLDVCGMHKRRLLSHANIQPVYTSTTYELINVLISVT
jgi:hypothetical protein